MDDALTGWERERSGVGRKWGRRQQRGSTLSGETTTTTMTPLHTLVSVGALAFSDLEPVIPFLLGGKEAMETVVDTPSLCLPSLPRVIYFSSLSTSEINDKDTVDLGGGKIVTGIVRESQGRKI